MLAEVGGSSDRRQAADFKQLKPEGLDLAEHAVQRGLIRQCSRQRGVRSVRPSPQGGERGAHRLADVAAHPGWQAALILREGNAPLDVGPQPDYIGKDLDAVADQLIKRYATARQP